MRCIASVSWFCVFWIRNTIRKVTIVVPVLITSCQVSLNLNSGPVIAHAAITSRARPKLNGRPAKRDAALARRENMLVC